MFAVKFCGFATLLALLSGAPVYAYEVPKRPLELRVQSADLVAVGTVVDLTSADAADPDAWAVATVRIGAILKGQSDATIRLVFRGSIAELDPRCCSLGKTYFMMLRRSPKGLYTSVDGPYGVFDIDPTKSLSDRAISWPGYPEASIRD